MADKKKLLERTKMDVRAVLIPNPNGVVLSSLNSEFREITGKSIPFKDLGFGTLIDFLKEICDTVRLSNDPGNGRVVCHAIATKRDEHIAKMVSKQKPSGGRGGGGGGGRGGGGYGHRGQPQDFARMQQQQQNRERGKMVAKTRLVPPEIQNQCASLMRNHRNGIRLENFQQQFHKMHDNWLDYVSYGFPTIEDCLSSMTQMLEVKRTGLGSSLVVPTFQYIQQWQQEDDKEAERWRQQQQRANQQQRHRNELRRPKEDFLPPLPPPSSGSKAAAVKSDIGSSTSQSYHLTTAAADNDQYTATSGLAALSLNQSAASIPENIKFGLASLMKTQVRIPLIKLASIYQEMFGKSFDYRDFGFASMAQFCASLPEIFEMRVEEVAGGGKKKKVEMLYFPASKSSETTVSVSASARGAVGSAAASSADLTSTHHHQMASRGGSSIKSSTAFLEAQEKVVLLLRELYELERKCTLRTLPKLYQSKHRVALSVEKLGFTDLTDFVRAMVSEDKVRVVVQADADASPLICLSMTEEGHLKHQLAVLDDSDEDDDDDSDAEEEEVEVQMTPIPVQDIRPFVDKDGFIDLYVREIYSPAKFFVAVSDPTLNTKFEDMTMDMNSFYDSYYDVEDLKLPRVEIGQLVAVRTHEGTAAVERNDSFSAAAESSSNLETTEWQRGIITAAAGIPGKVEVENIDIGNKTVVSLADDVRYLVTKFASLPCQAVMARCASIRPSGASGASGKWTDAAKHAFNKLIQAPGDAGILGKYHGLQRLMLEKVSLTLLDMASNKLDDGININDELVKAGHAVINPVNTDNMDSVRIAQGRAKNLPPLPDLACSSGDPWVPEINGKPICDARQVMRHPLFDPNDFLFADTVDLHMKRFIQKE